MSGRGVSGQVLLVAIRHAQLAGPLLSSAAATLCVAAVRRYLPFWHSCQKPQTLNLADACMTKHKMSQGSKTVAALLLIRWQVAALSATRGALHP